MSRKISVIHPSRGRAQQAFETTVNWLSKSDEVEYILSADSSDSQLSEYQRLYEGVGIIVNNNTSAIEAINNAAKVAVGDLLVVISDDFDCPKDWDKLLLDALQGNEDFLVKVNDGNLQPWIITLPIMDRLYYERFGYIYYPEYKHMFCDTEMTHVGHLLGRVITLPLIFQHRHYTQKGGQPKDAINEKNDATWKQGEVLYLSRLKDNFGLLETVNPNIPIGHAHWLRIKGVILT